MDDVAKQAILEALNHYGYFPSNIVFKRIEQNLAKINLVIMSPDTINVTYELKDMRHG